MHLDLVSHPAGPPLKPAFKVWASVDHAASFGDVATTNIWFGIGAPAARFVIPAEAEGGRSEGLWRTTCCEAFLRASGEAGYREWNFAPSGEWAAYDFAGYRDGMHEADVRTPYVRFEDNLTWWTLGATIATEAACTWELGLSVVLEEVDGTKSYWAISHPHGDKPDFHHPDCFAAKLP